MEAKTFMDGVDPGAVGRCGWEVDQTRRDLELLWWIGRFRFVTAEQIASRLGCTVQRANARARRLEQHGLVGRERTHLSQPRAVFLTGRGHELLGLPRRRSPRAQIQREHEAAIVDLALALETRLPPGTVVLTERECRQHDHTATGPPRYGAQIAGAGTGRGDRRRWPDLVITSPSGRTAVELELTPKGTSRLRAIIDGYRYSPFRDVVFAVRGAALHQRIEQIARRSQPTGALSALLEGKASTITVVAWQPGRGHARALAAMLADTHAS
jgi:DNA-binding MarR family transcriptional regulator